MKISFFEVTDEDQKNFSQLLADTKIDFYKGVINLENKSVAPDTEILSVFVNSQVTADVMDAMPGLKFITTRSMGFDHIDLEHAKNKGIAVANVPSYGSYTVAEFTFALMLSLSRNIPQAARQLKEDTNFNLESLKGFNLMGKTLGVIGTGRIGKNVIKIATGFGMHVLAYDAFPDATFSQQMNFKYVDLSQLLAGSDIVTIHTPYNKETYHLINKDNIKIFKKGAHLINTARGEIVETEALLWALKEGVIAEAALDVLEGERELKEEAHLLSGESSHAKDFKILVEDHVLIDLPQVIVTPHIAFYSEEAVREIRETTVQNIKSFINGQPQNIIATK